VADSLVARGPQTERREYDGAYEPGRLRRAATLAVKRLGPTRFAVRGQEEPVYRVDLAVDPPCYCKDSEYHGRGCKHELAARLHSGDMALVQALGEMLLKAEQRSKELARTRRRKSA
jgi:hypothetical protein